MKKRIISKFVGFFIAVVLVFITGFALMSWYPVSANNSPSVGLFGNGQDGALTISGNITDTPIDSACSGTSGSTSLSANNANFASGQAILIHQSQGVGAGQYERNVIQSYGPGTIMLQNPLEYTYSTGAQVLVLKQYTNVTISGGATWTAKAWNGTTGGILAFLYDGTLSGSGSISANGCGFRGAPNNTVQNTSGYQGEGESGAGGQSTNANGEAGGGGSYSGSYSPGTGGGGSYATQGTAGANNQGIGGNSGIPNGSLDLTSMLFGGGGGLGGSGNNSGSGGGGNGGGIIYLCGANYLFEGNLSSSGLNGANSIVGQRSAGGGAGAGGFYSY